MKRPAPSDPLLALLEESYDRPAWHGPNLRGSLRGLTADEAAWRPGPGRHSIWEIALHCAYWEYVVARRLGMEGKRGSFPRSPSNFPHQPEPSSRAWREDLALLDETHRRLVQIAAAARRRAARGASEASQPARLVRGIASHSIYHAGQIRLLIRLSGAKGRSRRA
jgi:uncharacterized damage-inducible protein DinB